MVIAKKHRTRGENRRHEEEWKEIRKEESIK
jgi:hypothetical protein